MKVQVHLLTFNEEEILPYTLRHYTTFATKIIIHDGFSTDRTRAIASSYGAEVRDWNTGGKINDKLAQQLKNTAWQGTDADWVVTADADELIYFPGGAALTLEMYERHRVAIVKPHGFEMCSDVFPTTQGQLYDEVKMGAADDKWYAKPILFSPKRISEMNFGVGAHTCRPVTKNGKNTMVPAMRSRPSTYLLHCKHLGPVERVAKEYRADLLRLSDINRQHGWGNQGDGLVHAQEKRVGIMSRLQRVIE